MSLKIKFGVNRFGVVCVGVLYASVLQCQADGLGYTPQSGPASVDTSIAGTKPDTQRAAELIQQAKAQTEALKKLTASPSPSPSSIGQVTLESYDTLCGQIEKSQPWGDGNNDAQSAEGQSGSQNFSGDSTKNISSPKPGTSAPPSVVVQYCKAAHDSKLGFENLDILWKVWAGVSSVCTYSCVASIAGLPTSKFLCTGASLAGSVTEGAITRDTQVLLQGVLQAGGTLMATMTTQGLGGPGGTDQKNTELKTPDAKGADVKTNDANTTSASANNAQSTDGKPADVQNVSAKDSSQASASQNQAAEKDFGACLGAVTAGIQAYQKALSAEQNKKACIANLTQVKNYVAPSLAGGAVSQENTQNINNNNQKSGPQSPHLMLSEGSAPKESSSKSLLGSQVSSVLAQTRSVCRGAKNNDSQAIDCALASSAVMGSPTLPVAIVKNPSFNDQVAKISKTPLSDLYQSPEASADPKRTLSGMLGNSAQSTGADASPVHAAIGSIGQEDAGGAFDANVEGAVASGGGGGGHGGGGESGGPDLNSMMQGLLGQMLGKDGKGKGPMGVLGLNFKGGRSPAKIFEDRSLNIFKRVSERYEDELKKQDVGAGASVPRHSR